MKCLAFLTPPQTPWLHHHAGRRESGNKHQVLPSNESVRTQKRWIFAFENQRIGSKSGSGTELALEPAW